MRTRDIILKDATDYAKQADGLMIGTPYKIDFKVAKRLITFISMMRHTGGELAGVEFQLLPFQIKFLIDVICTIRRDTGQRRYTSALLMLPRKNGKTELIAGLLNYFLFADTEKGKEIYCAANETDQARIIYKATESMINQAPALRKKCTVYKSTRTIDKASEFDDFIKVLTSNADTKDGLKPYVVVYDELHAAKDAELYTVLEEGMAHRSNPLFIIISTAGYNHQGIMKRKYDYAKQVQQGIIKDDSFYSMIFEPSEEDLGKDGEGWKREDVWLKVNPAIGYGVKIEYLRNKFIKALHSGEEEVAFKTKHLNMWTSSAKTWVRKDDWDVCNHGVDINDLIGRECYAGLDLSSTTDITALVLIFPNNSRFDVLCRFWIPKDNIKRRSTTDKVPYETWVRDGYITATDGRAVDYDYIYNQIIEDLGQFQIKFLAFDSWNSSDLRKRLEDSGLEDILLPFRQGFASMSAPVKEIETQVLKGALNHGGNPVLNWMMSNVAIAKDASDNVKIDKAKSSEKVDGMVALAMAFGAYMAAKKTDEAQISPYETMELRTL